MARTRSKERMIETMRALLQRQGYHGTGLNQVLKESGAPRGSLYFHFPGGKEELAEAAITSEREAVLERFSQLGKEPLPAGELIEVIAGIISRELAESDFSLGCPTATVALEAGAFSERLQRACCQVFKTQLTMLEQAFVGSGLPAKRAHELALFCFSALEGALLMSKTTRSIEPLQRAGAELRRVLEGELSV